MARPAGDAARRLSRVALFPPENLSGGDVPTSVVLRPFEMALAGGGLDVASGDLVDRFLVRHHVRNVAGLDAETSRAARDELGVDGVIICTVALHSAPAPPKIAFIARLVATGDEPRVLWIDGVGRAGDDSRGLLGLGEVTAIGELSKEAQRRLAGSLLAFLEGKGPAVTTCPGSRFQPELVYRSPGLDAGPSSVAVLPFVNESTRRNAGDAVSLEFVRQLMAAGYEVVEPGVVRRELIDHRIIMQGGVSLSAAEAVLALLRADLIVSGAVRKYADYVGGSGAAEVDFTVLVLDKRSNGIVWESTSTARGDDGVFMFDLGTVRTAGALTCRMATAVTSRMAGDHRPAGVRPSTSRMARERRFATR